MYDDLVQKIAEAGVKNDKPKEGDYLNEKGILTCGKCHQPKRKEIVTPGGRKMVVAVYCQCEMEQKAEEEAQKKRAEDYDKVLALKRCSIIDDKLRDASFDTCLVVKDNERQIRLCRRYVEKFDELFKKNQGLLLYGNVGTGKSHIAACICNSLMDNLIPVYTTSFAKLLEENQKSVDTPAIISNMKKARMVLFDDLGAERNTTYALEVVYNLIDSRYRQRMPMIVTTNRTIAEMQSETDIRYKRIYDRVLEYCYPVLFDGQSFRMKEAAKRFDEMDKLLGG